MKDAPFSADKAEHFFWHFWFVVIAGGLAGYELALGLSILIGLAWELKDFTMGQKLVRWSWIVKLTGGPVNIGGHKQFSAWDILYNLLGALTPKLLGAWPT